MLFANELQPEIKPGKNIMISNRLIYEEFRHYNENLEIPSNLLFNDTDIDLPTIRNYNLYTPLETYKKLHRNVFSNHGAFINFRLFKYVGSRFIKPKRSILKALLPAKRIIKSAEKKIHKLNNTIVPLILCGEKNSFTLLLQTSSESAGITSGHECRISEGILTSLLKSNCIEVVSSKHILCDKKIKNILNRIYLNYDIDYRDDGQFIYLNSEKIARHVELQPKVIGGKEILTEKIKKNGKDFNAVIITRDFKFDGHDFFKEGEIFNAPYCRIDYEIDNTSYKKRLLYSLKYSFKWKSILYKEMEEKIDSANKHLHKMHRLSEELREERNRFEMKVRERTLELAETNARLIELNRERTEFIANVTHEIRTPLTLIKSQIDGITDGSLGKYISSNSDIFRSMKRNSENLYNLVSDFLDFSKIDTNKIETNITTTKMAPFIASIINNFRPVMRQKKIACEFRNTATEMKANIDCGLFEKATNNLIINAIKFTPQEGRILIKLEETETEKIISVQDSGPGIDEHLKDKIFKRFYQADSSMSRNHEGSGIGLALVKEILKIHKGTVSVENNIDMGATFSIRLSKRTELIPDSNQIEDTVFHNIFEKISMPETPDTTPHNSLADEIDPTKKTVLLIEDNMEMSTLLRTMISREYNTITARHGEEALELCRKTRINAVVSDIMMPDMDGIQFLTEFRSIADFRKTPVIMLTGRTDTETKMESLSLGANDYIAKPFIPEELMARIRNIISISEPVKIKEFTPPESKHITEKTRAAIENAIEYLEDHFTEDLTRESLAFQFDLSPDHFSRMFKKYTGRKLSDYINRLRITRAASMLKGGDCKIIDVAFTTGFANLNSFNKSFHKVMGVTPGKYQRG